MSKSAGRPRSTYADEHDAQKAAARRAGRLLELKMMDEFNFGRDDSEADES